MYWEGTTSRCTLRFEYHSRDHRWENTKRQNNQWTKYNQTVKDKAWSWKEKPYHKEWRS